MQLTTFDFLNSTSDIVSKRSETFVKYKGYRTEDIRVSEDFILVTGEDSQDAEPKVLIYRRKPKNENPQYLWSVLNSSAGQYSDLIHHQNKTFILQSSPGTPQSGRLSLNHFSLQKLSLKFQATPDEFSQYCFVASGTQSSEMKICLHDLFDPQTDKLDRILTWSIITLSILAVSSLSISIAVYINKRRQSNNHIDDEEELQDTNQGAIY